MLEIHIVSCFVHGLFEEVVQWRVNIFKNTFRIDFNNTGLEFLRILAIQKEQFARKMLNEFNLLKTIIEANHNYYDVWNQMASWRVFGVYRKATFFREYKF